jgi:hypothetical protein
VQPSSEKAGPHLPETEISVKEAAHNSAVPKVVVDLQSLPKEPEQETMEKSQLSQAEKENTQADPESATGIQVACP